MEQSSKGESWSLTPFQNGSLQVRREKHQADKLPLVSALWLDDFDRLDGPIPGSPAHKFGQSVRLLKSAHQSGVSLDARSLRAGRQDLLDTSSPSPASDRHRQDRALIRILFQALASRRRQTIRNQNNSNFVSEYLYTSDSGKQGRDASGIASSYAWANSATNHIVNGFRSHTPDGFSSIDLMFLADHQGDRHVVAVHLATAAIAE
jgi:hypothetical protein